jgi:DNA-binding SARP family transcriptional activator
MSAEPILKIHLFEPLSVQLDARPPIDETYTRRKAKALFVYLYLNRGRQLSKYQILADLWPENEAAEPGRVKHTVQVLRATLEGKRPPGGWAVIQERGGFYSFNVATERYSDQEEFDQQVLAARRALADGDQQQALACTRRAIEVRRGPFLTEFRYDDWASVEIAREHDLFLEVLEQGARLEAAEGNGERAIDLLRAAIAEDPLHESSYAELMRYLWSHGRRTEALRVYHRLRDVLNRRLDVEPQLHTKQLYETIRRDQAMAV